MLRRQPTRIELTTDDVPPLTPLSPADSTTSTAVKNSRKPTSSSSSSSKRQDVAQTEFQDLLERQKQSTKQRLGLTLD